MDTRKKNLIDHLEKTLGIVTTACKNADVARSTHYNWMNEDEEYRKAVEDIDNIAVDFAESKLHKQIEKGDTTSIIFYLKTKGKRRGYIERQEIDYTDNTVKVVYESEPIQAASETGTDKE